MCDCIRDMDKLLSEHNARLLLPMFGKQRPFITLDKKESSKRGKLPMLMANFCPFCGEAYQEP